MRRQGPEDTAWEPLAERIRPDSARFAAGWERRFVADARRAEEAMELYRQLGYEVCADPVTPDDLAPGCDACELATLLRFQTIYTRTPGGRPG